MPTFSISSQIDRVEAAERALSAALGDIDTTMQGRQPYTPEAEAEERAAAWTTYTAVVDEVTEGFYAEIRQAEEARDIADARVANPRMGWKPEELAEYSTHVAAIEKDLITYSLADLEPQMRAALSMTNARLIAAWRDALNGRFAALQRDPETTAEQRVAAATWSAEFDKRVRERPAAIAELTAADKHLTALRAGRKRAAEITHARGVEKHRTALVASGQYGRLS